MEDELLQTATRSASYNALLQVAVRVSSFLLNGFVLHYVTTDVLGLVNVRLMLLYHTILFLSREPLRKASLTRTDNERDWNAIFNLLWLAIPIGMVCGLVLSLIWVSPLLEQPVLPWYQMGVASYYISSLIELLAEPLWVMGQMHQYVTIKLIAEGVPQVLRCVWVAMGVVLFQGYELPVFITGQVLYSLLYSAIYYGYFYYVINNHHHHLPILSLTAVLPAKLQEKWQSHELLSLSWSFFKQSLLKQFLTDGERYIMTILGVLSFAEQGVYDIVNNLGSLVARFIFQPIEESFYVFFAARLLRGMPSYKQDTNAVASSSKTLSLLLKFVTLISVIILIFGYSYSHLALRLYGGTRLVETSAPTLLRWYSLYVLFLAANGITECFMFAVMSQHKIEQYNKKLLLFSAIFLLAAVILTSLFGSVGFILANCINMTSRIVHSSSFISSFFGSPQSLVSSIPNYYMFITSIAVTLITMISEMLFCCSYGLLFQLIHAVIGGVCLLAVAMVIVLTEKDLCKLIIQRFPTRIQNIFKTLFLHEDIKID